MLASVPSRQTRMDRLPSDVHITWPDASGTVAPETAMEPVPANGVPSKRYCRARSPGGAAECQIARNVGVSVPPWSCSIR